MNLLDAEHHYRPSMSRLSRRLARCSSPLSWRRAVAALDEVSAMTMLLLKNARIVDGSTSARPAPTQVVIEHDRIREVGAKAKAANAEVIDLAGKTLMPGLIDCHVHTIAVLADLGRNAMLPDSLVTARASRVMHDMLMRGFTTVRGRRRCGFWP